MTSHSDAEMYAYIEELLAEKPEQQQKYHTRISPPPATTLKRVDKKAFNHILRAWRMHMPQGHTSERDLISFLRSAQTHIQR